MWDVSARWDKAIRSGAGTMVTECDVLLDRQVITNAPLTIVGGSVDIDVTAEVRARCSVEFAEPLQVPTGPSSVLSPYGYEIALRRGIDYGDGTDPEMVPLGVFGIQDSLADGETLLTQVSGEDRTRQVIDAAFEDDVEIVVGTNVADAIEAVIASGVSGLSFNLPTTIHTVLAGVLAAESSRWAPVYDMATSVGWDLFFDGLGVLTARPETSLADTPVWDIDEADIDGVGGVLLGVKLRLDRTKAFNRHPVKSSNAGAGQVFSAVAVDLDPASPTYYNGPFGKRSAKVWTSEWISSTSMATDAANARLAREKGVARSVDFSSVPNCALQGNDLVLIKREVLGLDEPQIIEKLRIGLGPEDPMTGSCRVRQDA